MPWNYDDQTEMGPANWPRLYPTKGQRQSPINIILDDDKLDSTCCQGRILTRCSLKNYQHELSDRLESRLQLTSSPSRHHLDSIGEELRTSPDSGRRSGGSFSDNNSDLSASSSPNTKLEQRNLKHQQHSNGNRLTRRESKLNEASHQETRFCTSKRKLFLGYPRYLGVVALENNGHAWQANIPTQISQHTRKYPLNCHPNKLLIQFLT